MGAPVRQNANGRGHCGDEVVDRSGLIVENIVFVGFADLDGGEDCEAAPFYAQGIQFGTLAATHGRRTAVGLRKCRREIRCNGEHCDCCDHANVAILG